MIDADDVKRLERWIADGASADEREQRVAAANALLFHARTADEVMKAKQLVDEAKKATESPAKAYGLVDPARPGYMRATREESIGPEQAALRAKAKGSPFAATTADKPKTPTVVSKRELADALARIRTASKE